MSSQALRLPSRKWSILVLSSAIMATVVVSYLLAIAVALAFLVSPYLLLVADPLSNGSVIVRILLSAFGVVVSFTILGSLLPRKKELELHGITIDLSKEPALAREIENVAASLREPMPSDVYLLGDANAFVMEAQGRRILGLGLPLLQMLSIGELRAVLAHEFAHYYAGDTRLGPYVHSAQLAMARVYQNLGSKSSALRYLTRWGIIRVLYLVLMKGMRAYWQLFIRIAHAVSRRQEFRSDELACHVAGSQPLITGLETIRRCHAGLNSYWSTFVVPVVTSGFKPDLAHEFQRFMQASHIARATSEQLAQQASVTKASPADTHPPLSKRIENARACNVPTPGSSEAASTQPAISLVHQLPALETALLKKLIPPSASADLKPFNWDTAGADIYIPSWRRQLEPLLSFFSAQTLANYPMLVLDPKPLARLIPDPPGAKPNLNQRMARAYDILFSALALCLLDNGWKLGLNPGELVFEKGESKLNIGSTLKDMRSGKLSIVEWGQYRAQHGIGNWPLAAAQPVACLT